MGCFEIGLVSQNGRETWFVRQIRRQNAPLSASYRQTARAFGNFRPAPCIWFRFEKSPLTRGLGPNSGFEPPPSFSGLPTELVERFESQISISRRRSVFRHANLPLRAALPLRRDFGRMQGSKSPV